MSRGELLKTIGYRVKEDNKGLSLVELIVAVAVGSIIAGAIAALIVISVRMYSKESTNIAGQYEIQTTLNQTVDSAESAQWFALGGVNKNVSTGEAICTKYVAFGKLKGASGSVVFEGEIFATDYASPSSKFNVYMNRYNSLTIGNVSDSGTKIAAEAANIKQKKYLLGEGATKYVVALDMGANRFVDDTTVTGYKGYYENPIIFDIDIKFEKNSMTGKVNKQARDKVTLRNRIKSPLYIEDKGGYYKPLD